jgi:hypothetical protein
MDTLHILNAMQHVAVLVTISKVEGDAPKKCITLALRERPVPGTVLHAERLGPLDRCTIRFEQPGQTIEIRNAARFVVSYAPINDTEGAFKIEGLES